MRVHKDIVVRPVLTVENSGLDAWATSGGVKR